MRRESRKCASGPINGNKTRAIEAALTLSEGVSFRRLSHCQMEDATDADALAPRDDMTPVNRMGILGTSGDQQPAT